MDLSTAKLPKIYKRNGKDCYLDPIRKRLIQITPEETVRQQVIWYLLNVLRVPEEMIAVEDHLSHYGIKSRNRADIVILAVNKDEKGFPLAVIECKAENVAIDEKAFSQAVSYCDDIGSTYMMVINGIWQYTYKYNADKDVYDEIEDLPVYEDMLTGECVLLPEPEKPEPLTYEELEPTLIKYNEETIANDWESDLSPYTSMRIALPVFNFWAALLDEDHKLPTGNYDLFELIEDYGVRQLTYGNASGGKFSGLYRSFLVKVEEDTEFFSIGLSTYMKASWFDDKGNMREDRHPLTSLNVAHDDGKSSHHALQLLVDEDCIASGKTVKFYHNGRIAIGRIGSGKKSELRDLLSRRFPKILTEDKYYLGSITADHMLRLNETDVIDLVVNLISYSIVRDEFREIVKARTEKTNSRRKQR